jgi:hypothetical protein
MALATKLGSQYDGDRDLYQALGYRTNLTYNDYVSQYSRQDIARAIINRPVAATWRGGIGIIESKDDKTTEFENAWYKLVKSLRLRSKFARLDRLSSLGRYAVMLLGLSDVQNNHDFAKPVEGSNLDLLYVKPFGEGNAQIAEWENDPNNERFGLPKTYSLHLYHPGNLGSSTLRVHHDRVIHVTDDLMESEVEGTPRLKGVFNRLQDLEKIVGGSAEMFWRGARPGYQGKVDKDYQMSDEAKEDLQDQLDEFEHNLRRFLINEGVDINTLQPQISDPTHHVSVQIDMISAETGIPKRILVGSERGELASTEDRNQWLDLISSRREEFAEPAILDPFVEKGIWFGFLPQPSTEDYEFVWNDLYSKSDKDKAELGKIRADSLASYAKEPGAQEVIPPDAFYRLFLGLNDEDIEQIEAIRLEYNQLEDREIEQDNEPEEET